MKASEIIPIAAIVLIFVSGGSTLSYYIGAENGRQDLINQQWDAHHSGTDYFKVSDCEKMMNHEQTMTWYECDKKVK